MYYEYDLYIAATDLTIPSSQIVLAGHDATFSCYLPMITWTFRQRLLPINAIDAGNGSLFIKQSTTHNEGNYTCSGLFFGTFISSDGLLRIRSEYIS